ncbi:MAG TPA: hypothetical protein ENN55_05715 [Firmicutes bacterium]|nr:hypothetical protein [Bacillota bacterium]
MKRSEKNLKFICFLTFLLLIAAGAQIKAENKNYDAGSAGKKLRDSVRPMSVKGSGPTGADYTEKNRGNWDPCILITEVLYDKEDNDKKETQVIVIKGIIKGVPGDTYIYGAGDDMPVAVSRAVNGEYELKIPAAGKDKISVKLWISAPDGNTAEKNPEIEIKNKQAHINIRG